MSDIALGYDAADLPCWVPEGARRYLAHTESGRPIRALAREAQCHASTILRQVRRIETRRDDPLVDAALRNLALRLSRSSLSDLKERAAMSRQTTQPPASAPTTKPATEPMTEAHLHREGMRILRALNATQAVLAVAEGMEMAVVVRDEPDGGATRTATVARDLAQAMALKEWISCDTPGRISRYRITGAGRAALRRHMAEGENAARGLAEGAARFVGATPAQSARARPGAGDSPLLGLARRRDREGHPFLSRGLVAAGERLEEDYELARLSPDAPEDWALFLDPTCAEQRPPSGPGARVAAALAALGPGLGDVVLRSCCLREGMESIERELGWSARSGKIVLRIALERLRQHYGGQADEDSMIG